jgi:hypothetical protein
LRVFRFRGRAWPKNNATTPTAPAPSQDFPLLEELVWKSDKMVDGFAGARPVIFCAAEWVITPYLAASRGAGCEPLCRVRHLRFDRCDLPKAADVAALLRAAPELRQLDGGAVRGRLKWRDDPEFEGLVHRNLRPIRFESCVGTRADKEILAAEFNELRAHHFPRLRTLTLERGFGTRSK